jgi:tRNA (cytosine38-C5)-methyltransferase
VALRYVRRQVSRHAKKFLYPLSKSSSTRDVLLFTLRSIGYTTLELLLTPLQFGIPNSRLRYYLLAKKSHLSFVSVPHESADHIWRQIPGLDLPLEAQNRCLLPTIREYLDDTGSNFEHFFVPDRVLEKWGRLFDIVLPSSQRTCCFTRGMHPCKIIMNRDHGMARIYTTRRTSRFYSTGK